MKSYDLWKQRKFWVRWTGQGWFTEHGFVAPVFCFSHWARLLLRPTCAAETTFSSSAQGFENGPAHETYAGEPYLLHQDVGPIFGYKEPLTIVLGK